MIERFRSFLIGKGFPKDRIRYNRDHLFVNSRPLLREFVAAKKMLEKIKKIGIISAYLAGRFDGDGCVNKDLRKDCRIVYGTKAEAEFDQKLVKKLGVIQTKIYYYRTSSTFCLYVSRYAAKEFLKRILSYSVKLQKLALVPRRDLGSSKAEPSW